MSVCVIVCFCIVFSIPGLMKDRRAFRYNLLLQPNITRPHRSAGLQVAASISSQFQFNFSPSPHAVLFCHFKGMEQSVSKAVSRKQRQRDAQGLQMTKRLLQRHPQLFLRRVETKVSRPARAPSSRTVRGRLLCSFLRSRSKESLFKTVPRK